jgi:hypothetical protein
VGSRLAESSYAGGCTVNRDECNRESTPNPRLTLSCTGLAYGEPVNSNVRRHSPSP